MKKNVVDDYCCYSFYLKKIQNILIKFTSKGRFKLFISPLLSTLLIISFNSSCKLKSLLIVCWVVVWYTICCFLVFSFSSVKK